MSRLFIAIAFVASVLWSFSGFLLNQVGNYAGFYCGPRSFRSFQGVVVFLYGATAATLMTLFYWKSYAGLRKVCEIVKTSGIQPREGIKEAAQKLLCFGVLMVGSFVFTLGPLTKILFLNLVHVRVPIQADMFAGIAVKLKGLADVIIIFNVPPSQNSLRTPSLVVPEGSVLGTTLGATSKFEKASGLRKGKMIQIQLVFRKIPVCKARSLNFAEDSQLIFRAHFQKVRNANGNVSARTIRRQSGIFSSEFFDE